MIQVHLFYLKKNISISALEMALEMAGPENRNWTSVTIG